MQQESIYLMLSEAFPGDVQIDGDGRHLNIRIVSDRFAGLNPLKRQQLVYEILSELIASGDIHAVNMQTYTPTEWETNHG